MSDADQQVTAVWEALKSWQQGDLILQEMDFFHLADLSRPLTAPSREEAEKVKFPDELGVIGSPVSGWVVLSQTCDIVRSPEFRPYLEISPLIQVTKEEVDATRRRKLPRYAYIPAAADQRLVADLDRVMTIEKAVAAGFEPVRGCPDSEAVVEFAADIARKRERFAFPDDFVAAMSSLRDRWLKRHEKNSSEWHHLSALREIRAAANPTWDAEEVEVTILLIIRTQPTDSKPDWSGWANEWKEVFNPTGAYKELKFLAVELKDLRASDYVKSVRLDFDQLSVPKLKK